MDKRSHEQKLQEEIRFGGNNQNIIQNNNMIDNSMGQKMNQNMIQNMGVGGENYYNYEMNNYNNNYDTSSYQNYNYSSLHFRIYGDPVSCNMNPRILNNILASQYFKEIYALKGYNETLEEIYNNVTYVEPWTIGVSGIPSTFFCCLYKLMLTKLSDEQLKGLINNQESPYLKCTGLLYIRYLSEPNDLWNWYSNFILDDQGKLYHHIN